MKNKIYKFNYTGLNSFWTVRFHKNSLRKERNKKLKLFTKLTKSWNNKH